MIAVQRGFRDRQLRTARGGNQPLIQGWPKKNRANVFLDLRSRAELAQQCSCTWMSALGGSLDAGQVRAGVDSRRSASSSAASSTTAEQCGQRRLAAFVFDIHVGVVRGEKLNHGVVSLRRGGVQRGVARVV